MHTLIVALVRNLVLAALYFAIFIRCAYSHHSLLFLFMVTLRRSVIKEKV